MPSYALQNRPQRKKSYRGKLPKLRQSAKKPFIIGFGILLLLIVISVVTAVVVTNNKGMFFLNMFFILVKNMFLVQRVVRLDSILQYTYM